MFSSNNVFREINSSSGKNTTTLIGISSGDYKDVPHIPSNIPLSQSHLLIPEGFEDIIDYEIDEVSQSLKLSILTDENRENIEINISQALFNPANIQASFPKFLIECTHISTSIDYFNPQGNNRYIFNQNELIWLCLQHRLVDFKRFNNAFSGLINSDIKAIRDFINNIPYVAYNAVQREKNTYVILGLYNFLSKSFKSINNNQCIGTILSAKAYHPTPIAMNILLSKLPLHYTSESMGEKSKYVLMPYEQGEVYRSLGHSTFKDEKGNWTAKSIFPPKSNLPARTKTHIGSDAHQVAYFKATSPFIRDYLPNVVSKTYSPKDECYIEALCVIHPILDGNNELGPSLKDKFLFGEIDVSPQISGTDLIVRETIVKQFEDIYAQEGKVLRANQKGIIVVGKDIEDNDIIIENCSKAILITKFIVGSLGYEKLVFNVTRKAGNARLDSNTGLKGVTCVRPDLGFITLKLKSNDTVDKRFIKKYSGEENLVDNHIKLKPTMVFGMNSYKAKENGIALARAALAVKMGLYTPKHKSGLLNDQDEHEILTAANSLPEYTYTDMFGNEHPVQIGLVYARFTELCHMYKSYKPQSFSFETGRWLEMLEDKTIFNEIWENYLNPERKKAVLELQRILLDQKDIFEEGIPVYSLSHIKMKKVLTDNDLILRTRVTAEIPSKLFDKDWNKGFILDLTSIYAGYVRIPSAEMLKIFCSKTEGGMYMYPQLVTYISRIFNYIFTGRQHLLRKSKNQRFNLISAYKSEINGMIYSDPENQKAMMMVQTLSRPEIPGFAGKQMTDTLLPPNTVLIFDWKVWKESSYKALGKDFALHELKHGFYGICVRSPSLWRKQLRAPRIWNEDDFRIYLFHTHGIILEDYITPALNRDTIFLSHDILKDSQADLDKH